MNLGMLFLLFVVAIGALFGLYFIGAQSTGVTVIDTYGNTTDSATNLTASTVQNLTSTGLTVSGGIVLIIGFIIALVIILALVAMATKKF